MGKRIYPLKSIKYWWAYDIEEICELFNVSSKTVRQWIKKGLSVMPNGNPALIYGYSLKQFLSKLNQSNKCKTEFDQMFCMKCKDSKKPYKKQVKIELIHNTLRLKALCSSCKSYMNKGYKIDDLQQVNRTFNTVDVLELYDCESSTSKVHFSDQETGTNITPYQIDLFSE